MFGLGNSTGYAPVTSKYACEASTSDSHVHVCKSAWGSKRYHVTNGGYKMDITLCSQHLNLVKGRKPNWKFEAFEVVE